MAITPASQAGDEGSIPFARSNLNSLSFEQSINFNYTVSISDHIYLPDHTGCFFMV